MRFMCKILQLSLAAIFLYISGLGLSFADGGPGRVKRCEWVPQIKNYDLWIFGKVMRSEEFRRLSKDFPKSARFTFPRDYIYYIKINNHCAVEVSAYTDEGDHLSRWKDFRLFKNGRVIESPAP